MGDHRRPLRERVRAAAMPIAACVLVLASSTSVDKGLRPFVEPGVVDLPLYQQSPDATPLTPYERRSCSSAILIATGSDPFYRLTSVADGVRFDIDADSQAEQLSWTERGTPVAFLAIDRDGDGAITSGRELFGRHTRPGSANGFSALADINMDTNGAVARGSVNADDPLLAKLLLWTDANHNGTSERSELRPAGEAFSDIGLGYQPQHGSDLFGNRFIFEGWAHVRTAPGRNSAASAEEDVQRRRRIYSVCFAQSM